MRRSIVVMVLLTACSSAAGSPSTTTAPTIPGSTPTTITVPSPVTTTPATTTPATTTTTEALPAGVTLAPDWLGLRVLPLRPDGFGEIQPTPAEMIDRRFVTPDHLPPPVGLEFRATIEPVPDSVVARSTWREECPVTLAQLRYVTVTFWGFDQKAHTGDLLLNAAIAEDIVGVFERLFNARFPIEEMRIIRMDELDAPPTGDSNVTSVFECREATGGTSWSQHAYGLAIDINPFHNPYLKKDVVLPELATAYVDRSNFRPGMIAPDDVVVQAFADIGWPWGGYWRSLKDWMHFSSNGN